MLRPNMKYAVLILMACLPVMAGAHGCHEVKPDTFPDIGQKCVVATDQEDSFLMRVRNFPIHLYIDRNFPDWDDKTLAEAVEKWNAVGRHVLGRELFEIRPADGIDFGALPLNSKEYCAEGTRRVPGIPVVRVLSHLRWDQVPQEDAARGVTVRCTPGGDGRQTEQVIGFRAFGESGSRRDFSDRLQIGVVLHELGHALGLHHSCSADKEKASSFFLSCGDLKYGHPYREAIMYPSLNESDWWKTELRTNDMERLYCFYTGKTRMERLREKARDNSRQAP